jgi:hypothetical protein
LVENTLRIGDSAWTLISSAESIGVSGRVEASTRPAIRSSVEPPSDDEPRSAGSSIATMPLESPELELLNQRSLAQRAVAAYATVYQPLLSALIRIRT